MNYINPIIRTGVYDPRSWEGGIEPWETWRISTQGKRKGQVTDADENPVPYAVVGVIYIPTRQIVCHVRCDEDGKYEVGGLRDNDGDYLLFAYPEAGKLGGRYNFARTWGL